MFEREEQEVLDVVDSNDVVIDTILRSDMMSLRDTPGRYLRVVEAFLQRPDGKVYLPRRAAEKKIFPGSLDHSAAGHMLRGETYEQAIVREVSEELGITTHIEDFLFIRKFTPTEDLFYFRNFYLLRTVSAPKLSLEHTEALWLDPTELKHVVNSDITAKHTLYEDIDALIQFLSKEYHG